MGFTFTKYSDFENNFTMISEDYISKEAIGVGFTKGPLSKKHNKFIFGTFFAALALSVATNQSLYTSEEDTVVASNTNDNSGFLYSPEADDVSDELVPLAQTYASSNNDKKEAMENYDDGLSDVDLADADAQINKEVSALASNTDKSLSRTDSAKWMSETVQSGDSISSIFKDLNISASTLANMIGSDTAIKKKVNNLKIGESLSFLVSDNGELLVFIKQVSDKEQIRFFKNANGYSSVYEKLGSYAMDDNSAGAAVALASLGNETKIEEKNADTPIKAPVIEPKKSSFESRGRLVLVTINHGETFSQAANRAGITYNEINRIIQMFKGKILFSRNIRSGDSMRVLFDKANGQGKIQAVEFNLSRGGKIASYLNNADGRYYDENGINDTATTFARFPFHARVRVTSQFNPARRHPVTGRVRPHNGVDFGLPVGSVIFAPSNGIVDKAAFSRSAGYYIVLRHHSGYSTVYMHLSKLSVKPGQRVKAGTIIARSGNTGISTGPHLHYEVRINGRAVNPLRVKLESSSSTVNSKARKAFAASVQKYKKELHQNNLMAKL